MIRKAIISFFVILTLTILTVFPVNAIIREDYTHTLTWTNEMSFEKELTINGIYIAMGGTRIADYDGDLGTGILVVSCCNIMFNEDTSIGVLRAKVEIIINDGLYEGGTIEGTHNSKMIAFDDTSGKTVYNQGTGPLKGIVINVKTINDGVTVEAQGTIIIID